METSRGSPGQPALRESLSPISWLVYFCFPGELRKVVRIVAEEFQARQEVAQIADEFGAVPVFFDDHSIPVEARIKTSCAAGVQRSLFVVLFASVHLGDVDKKEAVKRELATHASQRRYGQRLVVVAYTSRQGNRLTPVCANLTMKSSSGALQLIDACSVMAVAALHRLQVRKTPS